MPERRAVLAGCAAIAVLACSGCGAAETSTKSSTVTVYSSLPLQGPGAERSQQIVDGEKLALAQSRGQIGPFTINFRSLDDSTAEGGWEPDATLKAARQATQDPNAIALIGDADAGSTALSLPITNAAGLLQVTPVASYGGFTGDAGAGEGEPAKYLPSGTPSFARLIPPDAVQAELIARLLVRRGCTRLVTVLTRSGFDISLSRLLALAARRNGLVVGEPVRIPHDARTSPQARADMADDVVARRAGCAVVVADVTERPGALFAALYRADPQMTLVAPLALSDDSVARDLGPAAQRTIVIGPDARAARSPAFAAAFRRAYARPAGLWAATGYEAMRVILHSIAQAGAKGNDREAVIRALRSVRNRASALGRYSIAPDGDSTLRTLSTYRAQGNSLNFG